MKRNFSIRLGAAGFLACGLAACFDSGEGPDYDVPSGQYFQGAQLQVDGDGTVRILAKVAMIFTYTGPDNWRYPRYRVSNYQAVLYSREATGWKPHPFRNLDGNERSGSSLLPDENGALVACVWDNNKLRLHRRQQGAWIPLPGRPAPREALYYFTNTYGERLPGLGLSGDTAWLLAGPEQVENTPDYRFQLRLWKNGSKGPVLDDGANVSPLAFLTRKGFHYLAGLELGYNSMRPSSYFGDLVYYRWPSGPAPGGVRKKALRLQAEIGKAAFTTHNDELRLYAEIDSSVAPFILEGEADSALAPVRLVDAPGNPKPSQVAHTPPVVDAAGCLHTLEWTGFRISDGFTYVSSCRPNPEQMALPMPVYGLAALASPELVATSGRLLAAIILQGSPEENNPASFRPSWLYLGEFRDNHWNWDQVARHESAKPQGNATKSVK